jgi:hypothetical protein
LFGHAPLKTTVAAGEGSAAAIALNGDLVRNAVRDFTTGALV